MVSSHVIIISDKGRGFAVIMDSVSVSVPPVHQ